VGGQKKKTGGGRWTGRRLPALHSPAAGRAQAGEVPIHLQALNTGWWSRNDRRSRRGWRWRDTNGNVIYHIIEKKKGRGRTGPEGRCKPVRRRRTRHVVLFLSHPSFLAWSFFTGAGRTAKVVLLLCHHANSSENRNPKRGNGQGRSSVGVPLGVSALPVPRSSPVPVSPLLVGCCGWCRGLVPCCPDSDGLTHAVQQSASLFPDPSPRSCPVADWEGVHLT
jgi:hypothetical protein